MKDKWRPEPDLNNKAHVKSLSTPTPAFCAVCRRQAGHCGHGTLHEDALWACDDDECFEAIYGIREMSTADFNELENEALAAAAKAGLAYLKSLPGAEALRAEFAALKRDEAFEFLERVVDGFGAHLKSRLVASYRGPGRG